MPLGNVASGLKQVRLEEIVNESDGDQLVGKLAEGMTLKSITVKPKVITALLPTEEGKETAFSLTTTPIYLETLWGTTTIFCKIIAPPNVQPIEKRWPDVEVNLEIGH